jgi:hypothetical protein
MLRAASWHTEVRVSVVVPDSLTMPADVPRGELRMGTSSVVTRDTVHGHTIDFDRVIDLPAGRVQPGDEYARWRAFARSADTLLTRDVLVAK